jgi:hypothetical protein
MRYGTRPCERLGAVPLLMIEHMPVTPVARSNNNKAVATALRIRYR